ncbi:MAG TPA: cyclic nucleotide-binding domain-containing protein [Micromonosporaceae bacterium]|nr:cyclic nucleotide-binding domain-containing protein [Micromonosporaceae bacterium]
MITVQNLLAEHPFLAGLNERQLDRLSAWAHRAPLHAERRIFEEGGRADRFWLIRSGLVELHAVVPGRGRVPVETLGPGSVLGWSWMFPPYRWHFGATAVEPALTVELKAAGVRRICTEDPVLGLDLTRRFMAVVVDRLQNTRLRLVDLHVAEKADGPCGPRVAASRP